MYNEEFTKYLLNLENIDIEKSWRENFNELDPFINYILRINVYSIWFYSNQLEPNIKILLKNYIICDKKTVCCLDKLKTIGMINQNLVFNEEEIHFTFTHSTLHSMIY